MTPNQAYYEANYARFLPADRNAAIVDIGCGDGDFVRYLHAQGYRNILAVDIDRNALAALTALDGVTTVEAHADAAYVAKLNRTFDLIIVKQMLYYLERADAPAFVKALREAMTPEGALALEVFNGALISSRLTEVKDPYILTAYDEHSLRRLLSWNGFAVEAIFGFADGRRTLKGAIYRDLHRIAFATYRARLIIERGRDGELPTIGRKTVIAIARRG